MYESFDAKKSINVSLVELYIEMLYKVCVKYTHPNQLQILCNYV